MDDDPCLCVCHIPGHRITESANEWCCPCAGAPERERSTQVVQAPPPGRVSEAAPIIAEFEATHHN